MPRIRATGYGLRKVVGRVNGRSPRVWYRAYRSYLQISHSSIKDQESKVAARAQDMGGRAVWGRWTGKEILHFLSFLIRRQGYRYVPRGLPALDDVQ